MIKLNYKKIAFIIVGLLIISEVGYRVSQWPLLDIKYRNEKDIEIVNNMIDALENYKKKSWNYPLRINDDISSSVLKSEKDIAQWNKYWYYKLSDDKISIIVWIKLNYLKYLKNKDTVSGWFLYKDFYYKTSIWRNDFRIEEIYHHYE